MCSPEHKTTFKRQPMQITMPEGCFLVTKKATNGVVETISSTRQLPSICQRESTLQFPQHLSASMITSMYTDEENEELIELSDDDSTIGSLSRQSEEQDTIKDHSSSTNKHTNWRQIVLITPEEEKPISRSFGSSSSYKRNKHTKPKTKLFQVLRRYGKSSISFPRKLIARVTNQTSSEKWSPATLDRSTASTIDTTNDADLPTIDDDLLDHKRGNTLTNPDSDNKFFQENHPQKEQEQKRENMVMVHKESILNDGDNTEYDQFTRSYIPTSILSTDTSECLWKRRNSDVYLQYRSMSLQSDMRFLQTAASRREASNIDPHGWYDCSSSIVENGRSEIENFSDQTNHFDKKVWTNSKSDSTAVPNFKFMEFPQVCYIDTDKEHDENQADINLPEIQFPSLRRLSSIRRFPSTSISDSRILEKRKSEKKSRKKAEKKEESKLKKDKKKNKKNSSSEQAGGKKKESAKASSDSKQNKEKRRKDKEKKKEAKKQLKSETELIEFPDCDLDTMAKLRDLQEACPVVRTLTRKRVDEAPCMPQRRPSLASHSVLDLNHVSS